MGFLDAMKGDLQSLTPILAASLLSRIEARMGLEKVIDLDTIIDAEVSNPQRVLLLHGFGLKEHSMAGLGYSLRKQGFESFLRKYSSGDDLRAVAQRKSDSLTRFCQNSYQKVSPLKSNEGGLIKYWEREPLTRKVSIVGHSEGGLVGCEKAQNNPHLVNKVIAVGTPVYGSPLAHFLPWVPSCRQMRVGSQYLQELWDRGFPEEVEFHFVFSRYDQIVSPPPTHFTQRRRANVHVHFVDNVGHLGLIGPKCYGLISDLLKL